MKSRLLVTEAGVMVLDEDLRPVAAEKYKPSEAIQRYRSLQAGDVDPSLKSLLAKASEKGVETLLVEGDLLKEALAAEGVKAENLPEGEAELLRSRKIELMVEAGLVGSEDEAKRVIRDFALELSKAKIRELSAKPDLQVMQSIQALDEVDKTLNVTASRVKEWYGIYFPELEGFVDDSIAYAKFIEKFGRREKITEEDMAKMGFSSKKIEALLIAAEKSKGGEVRDEDLQRITILADEVVRLSSIRDSLTKHVERTMARIAPNITSLIGPTIGARLIAKSGGLEKMARRPASTIQVLGAEKALFRALRTGSRPPKHGIIFQHQSIHSAPKWQRGKIARSLAAKLAIAAKIDAYRGEKEEGLEAKLERRLADIREKYKEPPKPVRRPEKGEEKRRGRIEKRRRPAR